MVLLLVLGLGLGLAQRMWSTPDEDHYGGRMAHTRDVGLVEGRVELDTELSRVLARRDVPPLEVRVALPWGVASAEVEENGRFVLGGLPKSAVDLGVWLGGELLASVADIQTFVADGDIGPYDPRLDGLVLDGPLHVIELDVLGADGARLQDGWLAWRASGSGMFEAVAPVFDGAATIVALSELVDVQPILPGCDAPLRVCVFSGDRIVATPGARVVVEAPTMPEDVALRLELVSATLPGHFGGEAKLRAFEARGGWVDDGRAELLLPSAGKFAVRWVAYVRVGERVTRLREFDAPAVEFSATAFGTRELAVPFDSAKFALARAGHYARERRSTR